MKAAIKNPLTQLVAFLLLELWFVMQVRGSGILEWDVVVSYVRAVGLIAPVVHHFDRVAVDVKEVNFLLAVSPLFLVPKIFFWVQWLNSDRMRNYRYFVVSPLSKTVPRNSMDFVTDSLRTDSENASPARLQTISTSRAVFISLAALLLALMIGVFWPYVVYGIDVARDRPADFRELAVGEGGWKLWLSWSVYQMNLSAALLAVGYCVLAEYVRWFKALVTKA
jgi:hypothetical protein